MTLSAPEYIRAIAPYQAGKPIGELAREYDADFMHFTAGHFDDIGMTQFMDQDALGCSIPHAGESTGLAPGVHTVDIDIR